MIHLLFYHYKNTLLNESIIDIELYQGQATDYNFLNGKWKRLNGMVLTIESSISSLQNSINLQF